MRIISISGTRDCGKTTAIKSLISILFADKKKCAVIVNEEGKEIYDDAFINSHQLMVKYLRGG